MNQSRVESILQTAGIVGSNTSVCRLSGGYVKETYKVSLQNSHAETTVVVAFYPEIYDGKVSVISF